MCIDYIKAIIMGLYLIQRIGDDFSDGEGIGIGFRHGEDGYIHIGRAAAGLIVLDIHIIPLVPPFR